MQAGWLDRRFDAGEAVHLLLGGPGYEIIDKIWGGQDRGSVVLALVRWAGVDPTRRAVARKALWDAIDIAASDDDAEAILDLFYIAAFHEGNELFDLGAQQVRDTVGRTTWESRDRPGARRLVAKIAARFESPVEDLWDGPPCGWCRSDGIVSLEDAQVLAERGDVTVLGCPWCGTRWLTAAGRALEPIDPDQVQVHFPEARAIAPPDPFAPRRGNHR